MNKLIRTYALFTFVLLCISLSSAHAQDSLFEPTDPLVGSLLDVFISGQITVDESHSEDGLQYSLNAEGNGLSRIVHGYNYVPISNGSLHTFTYERFMQSDATDSLVSEESVGLENVTSNCSSGIQAAALVGLNLIGGQMLTDFNTNGREPRMTVKVAGEAQGSAEANIGVLSVTTNSTSEYYQSIYMEGDFDAFIRTDTGAIVGCHQLFQ